MRLAPPPPDEIHLPPGATQGYAVRRGTVIVCRAGHVELELPSPGLDELGHVLRLALRQGETCLIEDAGWLRCHARAPARVLRIDPPARATWLRPFRALRVRVMLRLAPERRTSPP
ncbi:hypothetical protein [Verticiella sediminum]|uniref:hypothetical protein n=1 Tax=Verticiella sediminum TaxID=1247510 RepID=UPI0014796884|nr:hypothetical protein [Verticiella sediminum]